MRIPLLILVFIFLSISALSQYGLSEDMKPDLLATYGNMLQDDCVKDDISRTVFFVIPDRYEKSFYIRVFDPDCGGMNDHSNGLWETNTAFEVFGGEGCICKRDTSELKLNGNSKSGTLLSRELFGEESLIDNSWFTFGPFEPTQGESLDESSGKYFKVVVEGRTGNDCNLYALFLSNSGEENIAIDGANLFHDVADVKFSESTEEESIKTDFTITAEPLDD